MTVANTLAYCNTSTITAVKNFIVEAPQSICNQERSLYDFLSPRIMSRTTKLVRYSLAIIYKLAYYLHKVHRVEHRKSATLENVRTNTLAYLLVKRNIYATKGQCYKTFSAVRYQFS
jgi:hypothetical protein